MDQIVLDVPNSLAKKFYALSIDEKKDAVSVISAWLNSKTNPELKRKKDVEKMFKLMDKMSREAEKRGLTDEILQEILNEE